MDVEDTIHKIESVEIQGATAVAEAGVSLVKELVEQEASDERVQEVVARLKAARPTEPFLFNALQIARATGDYDRVLSHIAESRQQIVAHGVEVVDDGDIVYTHCHSSTVVAVLKEAYKDRDFAVRVTETRPLYQGRKTAEELAAAGIPVELYVDSGARIALEEADHLFIGADAITAAGDVVNKIGSELFADAAQRCHVPVTIFTDSWKFDPRSHEGYNADLERRAAEEVWPNPPQGVEVVNYAFECVAADRVERIVSELGVHSPDTFVDIVRETYPELAD